MKVRLYRGPANGKVHYVPDNQTTIVVDKLIKPLKFSEYSDIMQSVAYRTYLYRRTHFQHPDGSIFFEWDQPRKVKNAKLSK